MKVSIFPNWYFALSRLPRFLFEVHVMPPSSPAHRTMAMGPSVHSTINRRGTDDVPSHSWLMFLTPYTALGLRRTTTDRRRTFRTETCDVKLSSMVGTVSGLPLQMSRV